MRVGIAGLGKMGRVFSEKLLAAGHDITVWNRSPGPAKEVGEKGAKVVGRPADLVSNCEIVITMVTDAKALADVFGGPEGLAARDMGGTLIVEMSTVAPQTHVELAAMTEAAGGRFIECPVSGSVAVAREGRLLGFAGGAAGDVERARPLLNDLCRRVDHVGPIGSGAALKLAINLPLNVYWHALGEALSLCVQHGVDPARVTEIFSDTSGGTNVMRVRHGAVAAALKGEKVVGTFDIDSVRKDLRAMLAAGKARGVEMPVTAQALAGYDEASKAGFGALDPAVETAYWAHGRKG